MRKFMVPYGTSSAHDEFGASFSFNRSLIADHFDVFKAAWNEVLNTTTKMTIVDFENLWIWLKWVVSTEGVTENNQTKATNFDGYKGLGLCRTLIFGTFREILPEVSDCLNRISLTELGKSDPYGLTRASLSEISRAFKVSTPNGIAYFFTCREWFYNRIMPVFVSFA